MKLFLPLTISTSAAPQNQNEPKKNIIRQSELFSTVFNSNISFSVSEFQRCRRRLALGKNKRLMSAQERGQRRKELVRGRCGCTLNNKKLIKPNIRILLVKKEHKKCFKYNARSRGGISLSSKFTHQDFSYV